MEVNDQDHMGRGFFCCCCFVFISGVFVVIVVHLSICLFFETEP